MRIQVPEQTLPGPEPTWPGERDMTRSVAVGLLLAGAFAVVGAMPALADESLSAAKQELHKYSQKPVFVAPGEAFDAKACAAGKKQLSIPNSSANPFLKGIIDRMKKAGAEVGLQVREWENQGQ